MQQHRRGGPIIAVIVTLSVIVALGFVRAASQLGSATTLHTTSLAGQAATATPTTTASGASPSGLPSLHIQGTQFVDDTGTTVRLIGATRQSLEYLCHGDGHFGATDFAAMRRWGMNVVRIPLSSEFWANAGGDCPDYRQTVTQAVNAAEGAGLYVILDLQWDAPFDTAYDRTHGGVQCPLPDTGKDLGLWRDLATIYAHDGAVLFDLFGEPHDTTWAAWQNGGTVTGGCYLINRNGGQYAAASYTAIGMRELVTQVRALAPNTILILSGLDWGYNLGGIGDGVGLNVPNIVYGTHPFNYASKAPSLWPHDFGDLAATHAVIATEFGSYDCGTAYISQAIQYFNARGMSWLAWSWSPGDCSGPSLLADWSGTPSQPYGAYIQQQMLKAAGA